jgi:DNA-binding transcriptional regulator YiaG
VAAMLGVQPATYGRWERDQKRPAINLLPGVLTLLGPGSCATKKSLPEERLLSARQLLGLSQAGLAEKLGVDRGTVGDWERGVRPRCRGAAIGHRAGHFPAAHAATSGFGAVSAAVF